MSEKSIPGGVFTGIILLFIGLGLLLGQTGAFVLIGIGAAFIASGLLKWLSTKNGD